MKQKALLNKFTEYKMKLKPKKIKLGRCQLYIGLGLIYLSLGLHELDKDPILGIILILLGITYIITSFNPQITILF